MKIAVYGRSFNDAFIPHIQLFFSKLEEANTSIWVYEPFLSFLRERVSLTTDVQSFTVSDPIKKEVDCLISIGGDGTFLDAAMQVGHASVPILGINTGRLGFLSSISRDEIESAIDDLTAGRFKLVQRNLLELDYEGADFNGQPYALNELTVLKNDSSSMITIQTWLDDQFLNAYWADGLIISTPTGSTAYSLSCGGPIILPGVEGLVITPIAPHNLNVRPVVVPDSSVIRLKVEGRGQTFLASLDSRSVTMQSSQELTIRKAGFQINLIQLPNESFLNTMRNKLMWGLDRRN